MLEILCKMFSKTIEYLYYNKKMPICSCPVCTDILSDEEEEKEKQIHVKNERGVKKTKMLKSVNSWITLPIVESK